jgi:protein required for attachment to host cells
MNLSKGATVAVADGEKLRLFQNTGDEAALSLTPFSAGEVGNENTGSGARHQSSSANPDASQVQEDNFAAGVAGILNKQVLEGGLKSLVVIAAPRTLGEMRKQYHPKLTEILAREIPKDLTGHPVADIESAVASA